MAKSIGNLHFAGEATCGTHPATVHGAYLSGIRAASEIAESVAGPIEMAHPLVPDKNDKIKFTRSKSSTPNGTTTRKRKGSSSISSSTETPTTTTTTQPKPSTSSSRKPISTDKSRKDAYDQALWINIYAELGPAPPRPTKSGLNPFLSTKRTTGPNAATHATKPGAQHLTTQTQRLPVTRSALRWPDVAYCQSGY